MAHPKRWARRRRPWPAIGPVAFALTAALGIAGCTSAPAAPAAAPRSSGPAITQAQARQVFDHYIAVSDRAALPHSGSLGLSVVTGVQRAIVAAGLQSHAVVAPASPSSASAAYGSSLRLRPLASQYTYGTPAFYLPERTGYPRFFVADVTRRLTGTNFLRGTSSGAAGTTTTSGPVLMLFEQASAGAPWLLGSTCVFSRGVAAPRLAADSAGYVPTVPLSDASLLAQPDTAGPLQAAVVDDGPASAASRAVAPGPLTTGLYEGARGHALGLTAPAGDVYQWTLQGSDLPMFALRTADGGALVFYAMALNTTVAVPDMINKAVPIRPGPPIQVPAGLLMLLPAGQTAPRVQVQAWETFSFAAVDPPADKARLQVIAIGGGLTSVTAK